ncbi:MAG: S41 family peptidase, partial [Burkholderiaceae bacterium]|nr:S41 family peptidase [Burkholderiaceae bacterium]
MKKKILLFVAPVLAGLLSGAASAQPEKAPEALTPVARSEIVQALGASMRTRYVFPELGQKVATALAAKLKRGGYDAITSPEALQAALTTDLRALGRDSHLRVRFEPRFRPGPPPGATPPPEELAHMRAAMAERGFGIDGVQRLPGNVGYLNLRGFFPTAFAAPSISAAMTLLGGTSALIVDLRGNGGGDTQTVAYLLSHLFAEGHEHHLNDIYNRLDGSTRSYWTVSSVGQRYTKPVYVLTGRKTFSAGEHFAYDIKTQKRGTLIGEVTGGAANPGEYVPLTRGFVAFVPTGRLINPITKTNWEHVGVTPDLAAP